MTRAYQTIWPVLAMLISFVALFALTWLFASDRRVSETPGSEPSASVSPPTTEAPTPPPVSTPAPGGVLMVSIVGQERDQDDLPGPPRPLFGRGRCAERHEQRLCLTEPFARDWEPQDGHAWDHSRSHPLSRLPTGQRFDLRFVHK